MPTRSLHAHSHVLAHTQHTFTHARLQLHERSTELHQWLLSLESLCSTYNSIQQSLLSIERPLLEIPLQQLHAVVQRGILSLDWTCGSAVDEYLVAVGLAARDMQGLVETLHSNAGRMRAIVGHWQKDVMLERKEGKVCRVVNTCWSISQICKWSMHMVNALQSGVDCTATH